MEPSRSQSSVEAGLDWLFRQFPSYQLVGSKAFKPTLENSQRILEYLNHPEKDLKLIHVAGSNGKGSVSSYLASVLKESGLKVGLFTSPHISHFSERIRVNGEAIDDISIEQFIKDVRKAPLDFSPSFFEITFGMALQHFQRKNCDVCVIETGLGGRLDATNVINPELSIITSISLEHTDMLGNTLEAIAKEKAGIIKHGTPVILGEGCKEVLPVFINKSKETDSEIHIADNPDPKWSTFFSARYQRENFACVREALKLLPYEFTDQTIELGIINVAKNTGYFGRYQVMEYSPKVVFDVAHNAAGISATLDMALANIDGELHLIYATSKDKDLEAISSVFPGEIHFYGTQFSNPRSLSVGELDAFFGRTNFKSSAYFENGPEALQAAKKKASRNDTILVLGSFFLLSDFF